MSKQKTVSKPIKSEVIMDKEIVLKTYIHRYEADIAKGLLDEKGIDNMISDEDVGGFRTGMIIGDTIKLIVNGKDLEKAKEVIKILGKFPSGKNNAPLTR